MSYIIQNMMISIHLHLVIWHSVHIDTSPLAVNTNMILSIIVIIFFIFLYWSHGDLEFKRERLYWLFSSFNKLKHLTSVYDKLTTNDVVVLSLRKKKKKRKKFNRFFETNKKSHHNFLYSAVHHPRHNRPLCQMAPDLWCTGTQPL